MGKDAHEQTHIRTKSSWAPRVNQPASRQRLPTQRYHQSYLQGKHTAALLKANYSANIKMTPPPAPPAQRWISNQPAPPNDARWRHLGQSRLGCQVFSDPKPSPKLRLPGPSPGDRVGPPGSDGLLGNGSNSLGARRAILAATREPLRQYRHAFAARSFTKLSPGREQSGGNLTPRKLPAESCKE